ncbi:MAG: hypothetical protein HQL31_13295 [Planctomycetes bacterium]|nr:hypothetical protein [Planctomycetota bacterium]
MSDEKKPCCGGEGKEHKGEACCSAPENSPRPAQAEASCCCSSGGAKHPPASSDCCSSSACSGVGRWLFWALIIAIAAIIGHAYYTKNCPISNNTTSPQTGAPELH